MTKLKELAIAIEQVDGTMSFTGEPSEHAVRQARAVLTALLEPSLTMRDAALTELSDITVSNPKASAWDAIRAYRAMIQAALDEVEG